MENYEKKYKEVLEKAKALYKASEPMSGCNVIIETLFPELAESEDEKIRKELIRFHKSTIDVDGIKGDDIIAWLEKQGTPAKLSEEEQNKFAKVVLRSCAMSFIDYLDAHKYEGKMCVSNGECEDIENAFHNAMWDRLHRYYCKYIEKQGEKKPEMKTAEESLGVDSKTYNKIVDECIFDEQNDSCVKDYNNIDPHFGKSIDKTESKFKVGDWITIKRK